MRTELTVCARPRILVFAPYFGDLPKYFQLWLDSCGRNPGVTWRVLCDPLAATYDIPPNVEIQETTLGKVCRTISEAVNCTINIAHPYKLCDLRPAYWALIQKNEHVDFWGHCDLDLIFGDLEKFFGKINLTNYGKIFSVGHLTLYKNSDAANNLFKMPVKNLDWRRIFSTPEHCGFDEHIGVNLIWKSLGQNYYVDESIIADIDPNIDRFERRSNYADYKNYTHQVFEYDHGKIFRHSFGRSGVRTEEFMYIHFQKRKILNSKTPERTARYFITPSGFIPFRDQEFSPFLFDSLNGKHRAWNVGENLYRTRKRIRLLRSKILLKT